MRNNPYPDEPTNAQPTDVIPGNVGPMADLPKKQAPPQAPQTPATDSSPDIDSAEARQEEARTVRYAIGKLNDFLQWFMAVLEIVLAMRFFLKLIGADPTNLFAGFLYALTDIILFPFSNIVHTPSLHQNQAFEWPTLIAMIIYYVLFWVIRRFLLILISGPEETTG